MPWLPNPLDAGPEQVSFGAWARLLNFKANHRKVVVGDDGRGGITGIVTSANPHDASSLHSNVALKCRGAALLPLLESELALARECGWDRGWDRRRRCPPATDPVSRETRRGCRCSPRARSARPSCATSRARAPATASTSRCSIYRSASVIHALIAAARRGVAVRVILDPNKDAFGRTKNGIPNRSVATELAAASDGAIKVRWFRTHGEQFHGKLVALRTANEFWFTLGSANLTRRNLGDFNLEANVAASVPPNSEIAASIGGWFETLWTNQGPPELEYTAEIRRLRGSRAGHLLAVPAHGIDRPVYFLTQSRRVGARRRAPRRSAASSSPMAAAVAALERSNHGAQAVFVGLRGPCGGETREQRAVAMPAKRAVERHVDGGSAAADPFLQTCNPPRSGRRVARKS